MDAAVTPHVPSPFLQPYPLHHYRLALIKQYYLISSGIMSGLDLCRINMNPRHWLQPDNTLPFCLCIFPWHHLGVYASTDHRSVHQFFTHFDTLCRSAVIKHHTGPRCPGLRRANFHCWFECTASNLTVQSTLNYSYLGMKL